jgi:hypothetical protein
MASSYRYKYVKNSSGAALTAANFPVTNDGDDKQNKIVRHVLVAADIGTGAGQVGNAGGLILDVVPSNYNVLWFEVNIFRPTLSGGLNKYNSIDNAVVDITLDEGAYTIEAYDIAFWLGTDNTLRVYDKGNAQANAHLVAGDVLIGRVTLGQPQDTSDKMNP